MFVDTMTQNAQAIIDLNLAVQERDKSIATKDARYVESVFVYFNMSVCCHCNILTHAVTCLLCYN